MMMMMMRRFVKRVLNSPQRRCQSIKQVALEMSGERQRRERCGSKAAPDEKCAENVRCGRNARYFQTMCECSGCGNTVNVLTDIVNS